VIIVSVVLVIALLFVGSQWVKPQSLKLSSLSYDANSPAIRQEQDQQR
jgi:hypothetical protein